MVFDIGDALFVDISKMPLVSIKVCHYIILVKTYVLEIRMMMQAI